MINSQAIYWYFFGHTDSVVIDDAPAVSVKAESNRVTSKANAVMALLDGLLEQDEAEKSKP